MKTSMQPALMVLKDQTILLALSEQLEYEPKVHLLHPVKISGDQNVIMSLWKPTHYAEDTHVLLHSDSLLTVLEPKADLRAKYLKKNGLKEEDLVVKQEDEKVLLNEEEQVPTGYDEYYEDNSPNYQEV